MFEDINLGVLDDKKYIPLFEKKYGVKNLSPEDAKQIANLAQKVQDLPDGSKRKTGCNGRTIKKSRRRI